MKLRWICFTISLLLLSSCAEETVSENTALPANSQEYLMGSTLYAQTAAEYKALCYQAYELAEMRVRENLNRGVDRPAVVLDLDETVLDNSPYTAWQVESGNPYTPETWSEWVASAEAEAVPGAVEFLQWADSMGVDLFYVSNRSIEGLTPTMQNLRDLGVPQVDSSRVLLKTDTSDKTERRKKVDETGATVVLYIGDNLGDYSAIWDKPATNPERLKALNERKDEIGVNFVVLPNSLYGAWEGAIYNYDWGVDDLTRDSLRRKFLKPWKPETSL